MLTPGADRIGNIQPGVCIRHVHPSGSSISGIITVDEIQFKAHLMYNYAPSARRKVFYKYCLELYGGKRNWSDHDECVIMSWDYFGTNLWEVDAYKVCPAQNCVNLHLRLGLRCADTSYYDIVLQQEPPPEAILPEDFTLVLKTSSHVADYEGGGARRYPSRAVAL